MSKGSKGMLGKLSLSTAQRLRDQLETRLAGQNGPEWCKETEKFLHKKPTWVVLQPISGDKVFTIDAVTETKILAEAEDPNFKKLGIYEPSPETPKTPVGVYELMNNATFSQMFGKLSNDRNKLCLTQRQIRNFMKKYCKWIRTEGYTIFFLFKYKSSFFVLFMSLGSLGSMDIGFNRLNSSYVWSGGRNRLVIPKLA